MTGRRGKAGLVVSSFILVSLMGLAHAQAQVTKIGVLEVTIDGGADPAIGRQVTARIAELVGERPNTKVIAPDDIRALLEQETQKQLLGCSDDSCLAEIAGALGVDVLVKARISKIDDGFAVSMSAIDAQKAEAMNHVSETWGGESIRLLDLVEPMVERLFAQPGELPVGQISVSGAVDGSQVFLDEQLAGTAPMAPISPVPVGGHLLRVIEEDQLPFEQWVVVRKGEVLEVPVQQELRPSKPVYATWWFWTATAVIVGGAAATTAVLLTSGDEGTGNPGATGVNVSVNADAAFFGGR